MFLGPLSQVKPEVPPALNKVPQPKLGLLLAGDFVWFVCVDHTFVAGHTVIQVLPPVDTAHD
jgi:hypothetical protein